ncbi:opacity protein-like surface antigen [Bartonella callosciuri]|uniref:Opacity protein-like surface antigen n=1 Tax=Bartonella callosciuri TaxID=686223 RepID=A0A840NQR4_9HYPH|nr:outer membrane beta-barrel protein [Bartonella callosciuri]MBB5073421.1 opacity protein-like surface antigen [Bartonella callosciuri]
MNMNRLLTTSIFALISASAVQAADVTVPRQPAPVASSALVAPNFTWTGFYLGGQIGGFSSKTDMGIISKDKTVPLSKDLSPKLSAFESGFYTGANIDLGNNFVFGIDTDLIWSGQKYTKTVTIGASDNAVVDNLVARSRRSARSLSGTPSSTTLAPTSQRTTQTNAVAGPKAAKPAAPRPVQAKSVVGRTVSVKAVIKQPEVARSETETAPVTVPVAPTQTQTPAPAASRTPAKAAQGPTAPAEKPVAATTETTVSAKSTTGETKTPAVSPGLGEGRLLLLGRSRTQAASEPELVLARSGSSSAAVTTQKEGLLPAAKQTVHTVNGTDRTTYSYHGHGASHGVGHGASANPQVTNSRASNPHGAQNGAGHGTQGTQAGDQNGSSVYGIEQIKEMVSELGLEYSDSAETFSHTLKQNWAGATRMRIGFASDRFMPYVAGGIAYAQLQDTVSISLKKEDGTGLSSKNLTDETKTMVGYTLGGGIDFAMLDNVIVRAEYRYSDFGKKKFAKEKLEMKYKTNDFRVGVAYKF